MTQPLPRGDMGKPWTEIHDAVNSLFAAMGELRQSPDSVGNQTRAALHDGRKTDALVLLAHLDDEYTIDLVEDLIPLSLHHGLAMEIRQLLGMLPYAKMSRVVPAAAWRQLAAIPDDDAYRRIAELFQHLGLHEPLTDLCRRAAASDDPDIREVAEDFTFRASNNG